MHISGGRGNAKALTAGSFSAYLRNSPVPPGSRVWLAGQRSIHKAVALIGNFLTGKALCILRKCPKTLRSDGGMLGPKAESRRSHRGGVATGDGSKQASSAVDRRGGQEGTSSTFSQTFAAFSAVSTRLPLFVRRAELSAP
jgi:hypothetical protein